MPATPAIDVREIVKRFGAFTAVNGISFAVEEGEIFGLLGPNGAGKSTLIRMLTTLLLPTAGTATVNGFDIAREQNGVRNSIGVIPQAMTSDLELSVEENLLIYAKLYGLPREKRKRLIAELLAAVELTEWADKQVKNLSGGMRRRVEIARGLVHEPRIFFLDEPTTGLDPQGRREVWSAISELVSGGTTVLLTTQYLEEADQLADRISMLRGGVIAAEGSPEELKSAIGGDWLDVSVADPADLPRLRELAGPFAAGDLRIDALAAKISIPVAERTRALVGLSAALTESGLEPLDISVRRPTLDEVFLHLNAGVAQ
jgi:ABC-2 type transport system ATP-binding protein